MLPQQAKPRTFFSGRTWRSLGSPAQPLVCRTPLFAFNWKPWQQGCSQPRSLSAPFSTFLVGFAPLNSGRRQQRPRRSGSVVARAAGRDLYSILGIPRNASKHLIKTVYRKLARRTHPDVCKEADAEERFKQICEAYEVLSDDQKRAIYDSFGEEGLRRGAGVSATRRERAGPASPFYKRTASSSSSSGRGGGSDSGGARGRGGSSSSARPGTTRAPPRPSPTPGADIRQVLHVEASEAELGTRRTVNVSRFEPCFTCLGRGRKTGNYCSRCSGLGWVVRGGPVPGAVEDCPTCGGGGTCDATCQACQGEGRVRSSQPISVQVPAGTPDGSWLRVRGAGDAGRCGGKPGDLFLRIVVVK